MAWQALIPIVTSAVSALSQKAPAPDQVQSSPLDRRMESLQSDPNNVLKQGRAALSSMDENTQKTLAPVLDEAIKKSALQRQQQGVV